MFLGLILGRKPWFDPFRPHLPPPNIYIVGKLWILAFIWRWAIKIWSILQAVRILLPSWDRIMHSYLHSVLKKIEPFIQGIHWCALVFSNWLKVLLRTAHKCIRAADMRGVDFVIGAIHPTFPPNIVTEHFGREILCAVQRHTNAPDKSEVDFPPISSFVLSSFQSGKGSQTNVSCVLCNLKWSLSAFYENNCLIWRTGPWLNSPEKKDCDVSGCFGLQHQQSPSFGWPSTICPTGNPWVQNQCSPKTR